MLPDMTNRSLFIFYVESQDRSSRFYGRVLDQPPALCVPGMTEFRLDDGSSLGLMPETGIQRLLGDALPDPTFATGRLRAEIYLVVDDPEQCLQRAVEAGAQLLSECQDRDWGHWAGYCLDVDGHVLGFGAPIE